MRRRAEALRHLGRAKSALAHERAPIGMELAHQVADLVRLRIDGSVAEEGLEVRGRMATAPLAIASMMVRPNASTRRLWWK